MKPPGHSFAPGSLDGNKLQLHIDFKYASITYISESAFKSVLDNNINKIEFSYLGSYQSYIDCEDCRNLWLITEKNINKL